MYWRGVGAALSLLAILLLGVLYDFRPVRVVFGWLERAFERIPVVRSIYGSSRDLAQYFMDSGGGGRPRKFSKVVAVSLGPGIRLMGLITQKDAALLPKGLGRKDCVLVYLPWSYQIGGFTVLVPLSAVEPMEMSVEEAMRFTMTAGVSGNGHAEQAARTGRAVPCG